MTFGKNAERYFSEVDQIQRLLSRTYYYHCATQVNVVVVRDGIEHCSNSTTSGNQQNRQSSSVEVAIVFPALRNRSSNRGTVAGRNVFYRIAGSQLCHS